MSSLDPPAVPLLRALCAAVAAGDTESAGRLAGAVREVLDADPTPAELTQLLHAAVCSACGAPLAGKHGHCQDRCVCDTTRCRCRMHSRLCKTAAESSPLKRTVATGPRRPACTACTTCGGCGGRLPERHGHLHGVAHCSPRCLGRVAYQQNAANADASPLRRPEARKQEQRRAR